MYAFSVYDRIKKKIYLVRDRVGIKPLYWTYQNDKFAFSSDLNALKSVKGIKLNVDRNSVCTFFDIIIFQPPNYQKVQN